MTLLERAATHGARITARKLMGYARYRFYCSACPDLHSANYVLTDARLAMNDHAREHIEEAKAKQ